MIRPGARLVACLLVVFALAATGVTWTTRRVAIPWTVAGNSMEPTLRPGDRVVVWLGAYRLRRPRVGDVVLFNGPRGIPMVKRIGIGPDNTSGVPDLLTPLAGEPAFWVEGDNPGASDDSRRFGRVPLRRMTGRVVFRYWPPSRWGAIE